MNVTAALPPTSTPAESGAVSGAQGSGAPNGFDAILAEVGAKSAETLDPGALPESREGAEKTGEAGAEAKPEDDNEIAAASSDAILTALAALMIPAPPADATSATAITATPAVPTPMIAVEASEATLTQAAPALAAEASVPVEAADAAAIPPPVEAAATVAAGSATVDEKAPGPQLAAAEAGLVAPLPGPKAERAERSEGMPATEDTARAVAQAVKTETAGAVTPAAFAPNGGGGEAANDSKAQISALSPIPDANPAAIPTQTRVGETPTPAVDAQAQAVRGSPDTVARLSADILKKLDGRSTRFELALDPVGLGRVDVKVEIGAHGHMTAALSFDNPQAVAELRGRSGELRSALQQAGFDLPDNALSFDLSNQGDSRKGAQTAWDFQDNSQNRGGAFAGRAFEAALSGAASLISDLPPRFAHARGGVDVRI